MNQKIIFFLLLFLSSCSTNKKTMTQPVDIFPNDLKENIQKRVAMKETPSIAVGIIDSTGTHFYSFGKTKYENGQQVDENTMYEIGSISKVFTSLLLAQMIAEGKMNLDDPIEKYLPNTKVPKYKEVKITLKHLATHASGLPSIPDNFTETESLENPYVNYGNKEMLEGLEATKLATQPGEGYAYSNFATGLLGYIVAKENGMTYEELFKQKVSRKLSMPNTTMTMTPKQKSQMAIGHDDDTAVSNWDFDALAGCGAWRSNVKEMLQFLNYQLTLNGNKRTKAVELTQQLHASNGSKVGLGWHFYKELLWHNGGTGGYRSFCGIDLEKNRGIIVLTNSTSSVDDIGLHYLDSTVPLIEPRVVVKLDDKIYEDYVGKYVISGIVPMVVTYKEEKLKVQLMEQPAFRIFPASETLFFLKVVEAEIEFFRDENGKVKSLVLDQNGIKQEAKRVE